MATLQQPTITSNAVPVTVENFPRAESDLYFSLIVKRGGFGKFDHNREPTPIDEQTVIRMNRDTLYSAAVFDLDAGPVTIALPDAGTRFMSMQIINEDQYSPHVFYESGSYTLTREAIGTRYVVVAIRTLVNPADPKDIEQVHALQDAIQVEQASPGRFEIPNWDQESQKKVRDALLVLATTLPDTKNMFGTKDQVDPVRFLIGSAMGWGANPPAEATYLNITPPQNDGKTVHKLIVKDVPVDGFWSISLYNAEGYFQQNDQHAYSVNNITAKPNADGSVTVQFGGCDGSVANCLPIMPSWNYMVRLYRPRTEILNDTWTFPEAQPVS
ncbi:carboxylesterase [filamentous cyanobacterium CCP1]|nr:carboxylesterase [filamentous cyanobacterium CCP2]PSB67193.1 carboxylesterase [filamentous cyanobacterium CCP1]